MTTDPLSSNPDTDQSIERPDLVKFQLAAMRLLQERVLSKGGAMPSEAALRAVCRTLAERALKARDAERASHSS